MDSVRHRMRNFDLKVESLETWPPQVLLSVANSPAGEIGPFTITPPSIDLATALNANTQAELVELARGFSEAIVPSPVWSLWRESLGMAAGAGLRLRIRTTDTFCSDMPWELLYDPERHFFLSLDTLSPIVRYLEGPIPHGERSEAMPLRLLLTSAAPIDFPTIKVGDELNKIAQALEPAVAKGILSVLPIQNHLQTRQIQTLLMHYRPQILHFAGHGVWQAESRQGFLLFEDADGRSARFDTDLLAMLLRSSDLRLVTLNACSTGESNSNTWAGIAQALIGAGVPAVVAMRSAITDLAAEAFAEIFFTVLADGRSLEQAITAGRRTVATLRASGLRPGEWLVPALFMRTADGYLWSLPHSDGKQETIRAVEAGSNSQTVVQVTSSRSIPSLTIPHAITSFVGRGRELAEIQQRIGQTRLLTLVGSGGCGKTRLAQQAARALVPSYPDGVWYINLATVLDSGLVIHAVAAVLSVKEESGLSLNEALVAFLRSKRALLVVDNCEHLIQSSANLLISLLQATSNIDVLVASREILRIAGEEVYSVYPLTLPSEGIGLDSATIAKAEAVQLFCERARLVAPNFQLTPANQETVAKICQHLDGLPLAIELAAARLRHLTLAELASRIEDRYRLLTGGSRVAEPHHQTLRAAFDWSYDLLSPGEKTVFAQSSVFAGSFTLRAVESVCSAGNLVHHPR